ncbi:MAG: Lrp/AsnC ligand binding domain-containing protein, partial [Euryarchaeota archaeon]|nr:Lrp/AsnC ligand binding domain-containing protein [Euryarchaeota archaeon]
NLLVTIQLTVDPTKFEEIIPKLIEYPQLVQVTATSGEYNLLVNGVFDNQAQLVEFLSSQLFKMNGVLKTNIITWLKEYKNSWKISL